MAPDYVQLLSFPKSLYIKPQIKGVLFVRLSIFLSVWMLKALRRNIRHPEATILYFLLQALLWGKGPAETFMETVEACSKVTCQ